MAPLTRQAAILGVLALIGCAGSAQPAQPAAIGAAPVVEVGGRTPVQRAEPLASAPTAPAPTAAPAATDTPKAAEEPAVGTVVSYGMLGLLRTDPGGSAPWGRDTQDDAQGNLWGAEPGHASGTGTGQGRATGGLGGKGGKVTAGTTSVAGRLPPEVIQRLVRQQLGRMKACYQAGLARNPNLHGRISVRFVIGQDGSVTSASNQGSDLPDGAVVACVVGTFTKMAFPQPEGGIVTVVYPLSFSPGDAASPAPKKAAPAPPAHKPN
jgi:hypothetical protein